MEVSKYKLEDAEFSFGSNNLGCTPSKIRLMYKDISD